MNTNAHDLSSSKLDWPQKESVMAKTGEEIVTNWLDEPGAVNTENLKKRIDAALREARAEGEIVGWEQARIMADAILGKNNQ